MQKWEYLRFYVYSVLGKVDTVSIDGKESNLIEKNWEAIHIYLNNLGKEGWELISHSIDEREEILYFKRLIE